MGAALLAWRQFAADGTTLTRCSIAQAAKIDRVDGQARKVSPWMDQRMRWRAYMIAVEHRVADPYTEFCG
jgi:hypothetical protein